MFSIRRAVLGARRPLAASRFFGSYKSISSDAELTKFMDDHKAQDKLIVIDWFATWCGPCVKISPFFAKLAEEHTDVAFAKVDVDECEQSAQAFGVEAMPTFTFYRKGKQVQKLVGADPTKLSSAVVTLKK